MREYIKGFDRVEARLERLMDITYMTQVEYQYRLEGDLKELHKGISELKTTMVALETTIRLQSELIDVLRMRLEKEGGW